MLPSRYPCVKRRDLRVQDLHFGMVGEVNSADSVFDESTRRDGIHANSFRAGNFTA